MFIRKFFHRLFGVTLVFALAFCTTSFAEPLDTLMIDNQQTLEDAKNYLINYSKVGINEFGKEFTTEYHFNTSQDLDAAAEYIVEYGLDAFNGMVENKVEEIVSQECQSKLITPYTTNPSTIRRIISGNGYHDISGETAGLASFDTLGTVEYMVSLSYRVNVKNNKITELKSISFDIPYISAAGSWGGLALPFHVTDTAAGVTANYTITKTLSIPIGNFEFEIKSETDNEIFALQTRLE